jgi:hypothetical protein
LRAATLDARDRHHPSTQSTAAGISRGKEHGYELLGLPDSEQVEATQDIVDPSTVATASPYPPIA